MKRLIIILLIFFYNFTYCQNKEIDTIVINFKNNQIFNKNYVKKHCLNGILTFSYYIFSDKSGEKIEYNFYLINENEKLKYSRSIRKKFLLLDLKYFSENSFYDFLHEYRNVVFFYQRKK